jgi:hypothetical protein
LIAEPGWEEVARLCHSNGSSEREAACASFGPHGMVEVDAIARNLDPADQKCRRKYAAIAPKEKTKITHRKTVAVP